MCGRRRIVILKERMSATMRLMGVEKKWKQRVFQLGSFSMMATADIASRET
jgi:hypothetical protein